MKFGMCAFILTVGAAALAAPNVQSGSVTLTQPSSGGTIRIGYVLEDGPAIVTCDILTNGVSIGAANLIGLEGAVNRKVESGTQTIAWKPWTTWTDRDFDQVRATAVVTAWSLASPPDYMVVDLKSGETRYYTCAEALPDGGVTNDLYKTERMAFRKIPAGGVEWRMGSYVKENWGVTNEVAHLVTLASDCYLAVYELTQKQYYNVMASMPNCNYKEADRDVHPVEQFNFFENRGWVLWNKSGTVNRSVGDHGFFYQLRQRAGGGFDYPLEALWEFACRAGSGNNLYDNSFGYTDLENWEVSNRLKKICAHKTGHTMPVGSYEPNAWGLYDMLGNVSECCLDHYADDNTTVDPNKGPTFSSINLTMRGGAYADEAYRLRTAFRVGDSWDGWLHRGLRVACPVDALPTR